VIGLHEHPGRVGGVVVQVGDQAEQLGSVTALGPLPRQHSQAADPDTAEAARRYASSSAGSFIIRTPDEVAAFFDGLDLLNPGLVDAGLWRTTQAEPVSMYQPPCLPALVRTRTSATSSRRRCEIPA
jgi:hypothetical protein